MIMDFNDLGSVAKDDQGILHLDISLIDEDPEQPRTEFDETTLKELAETIRLRGVKTPISVRKCDNGRYIVNHGARRLRASKLAGKTDIPAHIDNNYTRADQIIENIQRDALKPMDVARFIQSETNLGKTKVQIAEEIGKSKQWVNDVFSLLSLEPELKDMFEQGKFEGISAVVELNRLYKKSPFMVQSFISDHENADIITRKEIRVLANDISEAESVEEKDGTVFETHDDSQHNKPESGDESQPELDSGDDIQETSTLTESLPDGGASAEDDTEDDNAEFEEDTGNPNEQALDTDDESWSEGNGSSDTSGSTSPLPCPRETAEKIEDLEDLEDLPDDEKDSEENQPPVDLFKTIKELWARCDQYGRVSVVFRKSEHDGMVFVLTDNGVQEVRVQSLTLDDIVF